jgi:uncharacterized protein (DUF1501 family)
MQRRQFLKCGAAALGSAAMMSDLARMAHAVGPVSDYKALVCIFMFGGNDGNNLLVPRDAAGYAEYARGRGQRLALPLQDLQPLTLTNTAGREFALHPRMPQLATIINQGKAAVLANVGPLSAPLTQTQYRNQSAPIPPNLFSHSDQQFQWQTSVTDGPVRTGWGGRLLDLYLSQNQSQVASAVSLVGRSTFLNGAQASGFSVSSSGRFGLDFYQSDTDTDPVSVAFRKILTVQRPHLFEAAWLDTLSRSIETQRVFNNAIHAAPAFQTQFPNTDLGNQLKTAARLIAARNSLGVKRQTFFCSLGGFDTHGEAQLSDQGDNLDNVSRAMAAFYNATVELGVASQVTAFTESDFGRDLPANGNGGSDHGWGSHHLIVGGAVNGAKLYGKFPTLVVDGPDDSGGGRWIPTTAVDEYAATFARWFGVSNSEMPTLFPNIGRFANNLDFLI